MKSFALAAVVWTAAAFAQGVGGVTVVNYAGFTGTFPVAPGSIASAYGNFTGVPTTIAPEPLTPMPRELTGVRLRVNGADAPLYFVSASQINFVVPSATPMGLQPVEVLLKGSVIARGSVNVYQVGPGLAALTAESHRPGIVQNQNFDVNSEHLRAGRGDVIQIYATGCGPSNPPVEDGTTPADLAPVAAAVKAYFLDEEAQVQYAGAHPQFPGICQVNAFVPELPVITGQVPIFITVNGVPSNVVTVWVE